MIRLDELLARLHGLDARTVSSWIEAGWVRPAGLGDPPDFDEVDVARVRLILELRDELEVDESAMPMILGLLDQLHAARRQLRVLAEALERARGG